MNARRTARNLLMVLGTTGLAMEVCDLFTTERRRRQNAELLRAQKAQMLRDFRILSGVTPTPPNT